MRTPFVKTLKTNAGDYCLSGQVSLARGLCMCVLLLKESISSQVSSGVKLVTVWELSDFTGEESGFYNSAHKTTKITGCSRRRCIRITSVKLSASTREAEYAAAWHSDLWSGPLALVLPLGNGEGHVLQSFLVGLWGTDLWDHRAQ